MAGTVATVISLGGNLPMGERPIMKALRGNRTNGLEIRIQPAGNGYGYLVVNAKIKANAEAGMMEILKLYKGFGGKEYDNDVLPSDAPKPGRAGINNDMLRRIPTMAELHGKSQEEFDRETAARLQG